MSFISTKYLYINSANRDSGTINNFTVNSSFGMFGQNANNTYLKMSLDEISLNYSWFNIKNGINNQFSFWDGITENIISIPEGNYNVFELMDLLNGYLDTIYEVTYNPNQNKYIFTAYDELYSLTCINAECFLGLQNGIQYVGSFSSIKVISMTYHNNIYLNSDIARLEDSYDNNLSQKITNSTILARIPIISAPFSNINYKNNQNMGDGVYLAVKQLDSIKFWLTTEHGELELDRDFTFLLKVNIFKYA